jgi:probable DNA repair protein
MIFIWQMIQTRFLPGEGCLSTFQHQIITAAQNGALILTANNRLSRHLAAAFDEQMQADGKAVWQTPQIISFDGWLHRSLAELGESWRLLEGFPALRIWEQLIEQDSAGSELELLQVAATARKAQEAHNWSVAYSCSLKSFSLTEDQQVFSRWQQAYKKTIAEQGWLDRSELPFFICQALSDGRLLAPTAVLLVGFDQLSPELLELERTLNQLNVACRFLQPEAVPQTAMQLYPCAEPRQEVLAAARWARNLLEQGEGKIGVVVPDLQTRRKEIERIFRQQIDPAADLNLLDQETAFSLSLGAPLLEQGPVYAALEILSVSYHLSLDKASFLLRTPYLGGGVTEAERRAAFDSRLRTFRQQRISLKKLAELAGLEQRSEKASKIFTGLLKAVENRERLLPGEWAARFSQQLQSAGWPGERSLSSSEYQMVKAWQEKLLPAFASLDPVSRLLDRSQALSLLRRLAAEIEFQLEAPTGPVQVVGLLESAGLSFDHLWVMGMNEECFPAAARPNPFLPISLQVEKMMPHCSAVKELEFARNVLQRLKAASRDIVFSYPQRSGDCELRPSPLVKELPQSAPRFATLQDPLSRQTGEALQLDERYETSGPQLSGARGEGGTAILKDQALCPFRAFAHFRLQASAFEQPQPGLDPLTRGNLLHKVLEHFWRQVQTQQRLLELSAAERESLIAAQVATALDDYFAERGRPPEKLIEIEQLRLQTLVAEWLDGVESERVGFSVVECEQEHFEQIGPLMIRTVIDRIDQLDDGQRIILDYKTGLIKIDSLLAERLLEPQLPIYAIADQQAAGGVAFAQVRRGDCKLVGVTAEDGLLPRVASVGGNKVAQELQLHSWPELLAYWQQQLEQLASDFVAGKAAVDPVDLELACKFCDLRSLCRIAEAQLVATDGEGN